MTADVDGWHPDPFGLHEFRYFSSGGKPTKLVRDKGVESYDDSPASAADANPSISEEGLQSPQLTESSVQAAYEGTP
jgi:hypothetical protein